MQSGASLPWHAGGSGKHVDVPLACDGSGMYAPQHVHFCSQYSSTPQVAAPHETGWRVVAPGGGGGGPPVPLPLPAPDVV